MRKILDSMVGPKYSQVSHKDYKDRVKPIILTLTFLVFFSCYRNDCKKDLFFDKKFRDSIQIMTLSENGKETSIEDKLDAIRFLEAVTGYKSKIEDIEYPVYKDKSIFIKDKHAWQNWYISNRCKLKDSQIDSLLVIYNNYKL